MNGYLLPLRCSDCGHPLQHVTASKVSAGSSCSAVAECDHCGRGFSVHVQLRPMPKFARSSA